MGDFLRPEGLRHAIPVHFKAGRTRQCTGRHSILHSPRQLKPPAFAQGPRLLSVAPVIAVVLRL